MNSIFRATTVVFFALLAVATVHGQRPKAEQYLPPDKFELKTETDDKGLLQWAEHKQATCLPCRSLKTTTCWHCDGLDRNWKCLECKKTKKATCRTCAGVGYFPNPLERAPCPGCRGAGIMPCDVCRWEGNFKIRGSGKDFKKCDGCKGDGAYACTVCKGKRFVKPVKLKPSVGAAKLKDLLRAKKAVDAVLESIDDWSPGGVNTRKEMKVYVKLLKPGTSLFPALKRQQKFADAVVKRVLKGEHWVGHEDMEARAMTRLKSHTEYYLKHQKHLLELCIARAEHNEKVKAEGKD